MKDHRGARGDACVAHTSATKSRLEVYAAESIGTLGTYIEPVVQIVTEPGFPKFFRARIKVDNRGNMLFNFTLASNNLGNGRQMGLVRMHPRAKLINCLKEKK